MNSNATKIERDKKAEELEHLRRFCKCQHFFRTPHPCSNARCPCHVCQRFQARKMSAMLDRRFHEAAAGAVHNLFTLVVRPPSNWHWIEGRGRFHEKLRDNIKRKYGCDFAYRYFDEFDADQRVHSHYVVVTDAPLDVAGIKAVFRDLLAKVWERIGPDMPPSLRDGHEDFFWDTPRWLAIAASDPLDWSVYCDTPQSLPALARYLPKNLRDRSGVQPVPDGWPLRTRRGRGFFGKPMGDYWRETYRAWYSSPVAPPVDEQDAQDDGHNGADEPDRTTNAPAPSVAAGKVSPRPARPVWDQPHASPAALSRTGVARAPPAARTRNNYTHNTKEMMAWTIWMYCGRNWTGLKGGSSTLGVSRGGRWRTSPGSTRATCTGVWRR